MRPAEDRLHVADADAAADGVVDAHEVVADLMDPACRGRLGAVGDVLAVDVQLAAVLAVPVPVEAEVQAGAEMKPGVAERGDGEGRAEPSPIVKSSVAACSRRLSSRRRRSASSAANGSRVPSACSMPPCNSARSQSPTAWRW